MGKNLSFEQRISLEASSLHAARQWYGHDAEQILWTNNQSLIALGNIGKLAIRDIERVLCDKEIPEILKVHARSYITWQDYSAATNLLRIAVLFLHGGIYLDATWKVDFYEKEMPLDPPPTKKVKITAEEPPEIALCVKEQQHTASFPTFFDKSKQSLLKSLETSYVHGAVAHDDNPWLLSHLPDIHLMIARAARSVFFNDVVNFASYLLSTELYRKHREKYLKLMHQTVFNQPGFIRSHMVSNLHPGALVLSGSVVNSAIHNLYTQPYPYYLSNPGYAALVLQPYTDRTLYNEKLGLRKYPGESWAKFDPRKQGSVESPLP